MQPARTSTKHSVALNGRKTSVTVEDAFWVGLREIAVARAMSLPQLIGAINRDRRRGNLSSAIRVFVLRHYVDQYKSNPVR